jgi:hypothetical protein
MLLNQTANVELTTKAQPNHEMETQRVINGLPVILSFAKSSDDKTITRVMDLMLTSFKNKEFKEFNHDLDK